uniref:Radical SAM superfamily protein n=1 Tax=viral metagenome TaxID=1070528 RepID=A0A6M3IK91_9ZZZZ
MKYNKAEGYYGSPRLSGEVLDCSMPMTFDQYSVCGYDCLYCFSQYQRGMNKGGTEESAIRYYTKRVKVVNVAAFKKLFRPDYSGFFSDYIKNRMTMQWGGLSDPFCPIEEQFGIGYELLTFLKMIKYPICFSSKSDLLLRDEKYFELFKGSKNWSYKGTIISLDDRRNNRMEIRCPSAETRLKVLEKLGSIGIWTILRLRPFIIGYSDYSFEELIKRAADVGCRAISTEFFCLEMRSLSKTLIKKRYGLMSKLCGRNIVKFYRNISPGSGYLRLNYQIKVPYINRMRELCDKYHLNLHVSDAHHKEKGVSGSCCGLPDAETNKPSLSNYNLCQFCNALQIAKKQGFVKFSDISIHAKDWMNQPIVDAPAFNTTSEPHRNSLRNMSVLMYMRNIWNNPKSGKSPYVYFGGVLVPSDLDENGDIIYTLNRELYGV